MKIVTVFLGIGLILIILFFLIINPVLKQTSACFVASTSQLKEATAKTSTLPGAERTSLVCTSSRRSLIDLSACFLEVKKKPFGSFIIQNYPVISKQVHNAVGQHNQTCPGDSVSPDLF